MRLFESLSFAVVLLAFTSLTARAQPDLKPTREPTPVPQITHSYAASPYAVEYLKKLLAPARKTLRKEGIPFDPYITIQDDWRTLIDPVFLNLPEMKRTLRVTEPMKGIYLAQTLLVGETVRLKGNTILIIGELAPDDENLNLEIRGQGDFFMFIVNKPKRTGTRPLRGSINIETTGHCAVFGLSATHYPFHIKCKGEGGLF
jgi:hypothetical protein